MLDIFGGLSGDLMVLDAYLEDLERRRLDPSQGRDLWKLERQQHFSEPNEPSWVAFSRGHWDESLRLIEAEREGFKKYYQEAADCGIEFHRVRVVEEPIIPYLQWELNFLRLEQECGEKIRVVGPERVRQFEANGPLPELVTVGADTVYRILYNERGVSEAAIRFVDYQATQRCTDFIRSLYTVGQELSSFFERKVAHLEPPRME
jgi:hypothetical protein